MNEYEAGFLCFGGAAFILRGDLVRLEFDPSFGV